MDLLIIEPLEAEVMEWLSARYQVRYAPELAFDPRAFRQALYNVRSTIVRPRIPASHGEGIACRPQKAPASPPATDAVVSVSLP